MSQFIRLRLAAIGVTLLAGFAKAGVVDTVDGRQLAGEVSIDHAGGITVAAADGGPISLSLAQITHIDFRSTSELTKLAAATDVGLPAPWQSTDIGSVHRPGKAAFDSGGLLLRATGWGLWTDVDSGQFLHRDLDGDGQMIALVSRKTENAPRVAAGLMIRDSLDPTAPFVAILFGASMHIDVLARPLPEKPISSDEVLDKNAKAWMRIERSGDWITCYRSKDGAFWQAIGSQEIKMAAKVQIGLVAATYVNALPGVAHFENVIFAPGRPENTQLKASPLPSSGIIRQDGSGTAGTVNWIKNGSITLLGTSENAKPTAMPLSDVAWILFRPGTFDADLLSTHQTPGVLLQNGDFLETDISDLVDGKLSVSSVLFGDKTFDISREVLAIVLKQPTRWRGAYHVRTKQGDIFTAATLELTDAGATADKQQFPLADLAEISTPVMAATADTK